MREKEWLLSIPYRESFTRAGVFGHIGNIAMRIDVEIHFTLGMGGMAFPFSIGSRTNPSQETSVLRFGQFRPSENRTDNTQLSETGPARTGKDERGKSWKRQD